ncbi:MAG: TetR/AcrR family transcriptional regulator [Candidatus Methylomirabilales bacterium]
MRDATHTKELIAKTALHLFVEKGITETTIRDIAGAAGVAEGTLYRHYPGKEDLAWELFSKNFTAFAMELDRLQRNHHTLKAKLEVMVRHFCTFFDKDPILFSYLLLAQHGQLKRVTPDMPHPMVVLEGVIAHGMSQGEVSKADPTVAAAMVMGVVLQVAVSKVYGRIKRSLTSLADIVVTAAWRVLEA